ncbi:hypothetical protein AKJ16_DCAP14898 [Drosera capensis]
MLDGDILVVGVKEKKQRVHDDRFRRRRRRRRIDGDDDNGVAVMLGRRKEMGARLRKGVTFTLMLTASLSHSISL